MASVAKNGCNGKAPEHRTLFPATEMRLYKSWTPICRGGDMDIIRESVLKCLMEMDRTVKREISDWLRVNRVQP